FRFISVNVTNLHFNEDSRDFTGQTKFRIPNEFEMRDALESVKQMGMPAIRIHPLSIRNHNDDPIIPKHILGIGQYNEDAMRSFDKLLQLANEFGIRIIIPLIDHHDFFGGIPSYLAFRGEIIEDFLSNPDRKMESFYNAPQIIQDFKTNVDIFLNRTNTYTGIKYKDDKAVLCWETGNELRGATPQWTHEICKFIKSIDSNHLTMDGLFAKVARKESADDPYVDILTIHLYPDAYVQLESNFEHCKGKKPLIVGEFGFMTTNAARDILNYMIDNSVSGACLWSLRYHKREGGFYFHLEGWSPNSRFKSYHFPGFASGDSYDETNMLNLMREMSYKIQGLDVPKMPKPKAPKMLDITSVGDINWQGSVGAAGYDIQRSENKFSWQTIAENISDARYQYRPLFNDTTAQIGKTYYYRVIAINSTGKSKPSNIVGPVKVQTQRLVDELCDFSKIYAYQTDVVIDDTVVDKTRDDMFRLKASAGKRVIYKTDGNIKAVKLYTFYPGEISDVKLSVSPDNQNYSPLPTKKTIFYHEKNLYIPVLFEAENNSNANFLEIEFTTDTQLSAIEIDFQ
ncbi:MAG TPA: cellulase family glycosylhydrolase, partial [Sedimentisphaerales bacterium]|nr:cellulase family glycosylhydrolase [Sedimentisphaerales bacterium]